MASFFLPRFVLEKAIMYVVVHLEQDVFTRPVKEIAEAITEEPKELVEEPKEEPRGDQLGEPQEERHEPFEQLGRAQ